jgi:hypothetical protein
MSLRSGGQRRGPPTHEALWNTAAVAVWLQQRTQPCGENGVRSSLVHPLVHTKFD